MFNSMPILDPDFNITYMMALILNYWLNNAHVEKGRPLCLKPLEEQYPYLNIAGSLQYSRMYILSFFRRAKKPKNDLCGTDDFLGEPGNFMCTYDILFL